MNVYENSGVYAIINPKEQIYIGSTTNFKRRFYQYKGMYEKSQKKLYNSFKKYGVENHKFIIIDFCDFDSLYERERYWGEYYQVLDRDKGLNLSLPGVGEIKKAYSEETRKKIGDAHRGKTISEEQKKIMLNAVKGKKQTQEHINKRKMFGENNPAYGKAYFKGHHHTNETKRKLSDDRKGKGLLGENNNAKKVIDNHTGIVYGSAKEVSIKFNINYATLKAWLQGRNKNEGRFEYVSISKTNVSAK